jgi:Zn-dependent protease with chaperone function
MASAIGAVVVGLIFGLIAAIISVVSGIAVAVVVAVGLYIALRRLAPAGVARSIGATALEPGQLPRVETLLSGLSVTMGVATPSVAVLVDEVPNAAIISTKTGPTAVLTTGLVSALSVVELEGVLAHLLALQRLEAVERGTSGGGLALLLGALGRRGAVSHRLIGQGRLLKADEVAALAVRYPPGLAAALQAMEAAGAPAPSSLFSSPVYDTLRWLFVDPSIGRRSAAEAIGDVDATEVRRRVLAER